MRNNEVNAISHILST